MTRCRRSSSSSTPEQFPRDAVPPGAGEAHRLARRLVQARQRLLPGHPRRRVLRRPRARRRRRECYANEVTVPLVVGKTVDAANERLAEKPLGSELIGVPGEARQAARLRHQAGAAERLPLGERHGAALRHAARSALRAAAEPRRLERRRREVAPPEAQGHDDDHLRQGARRARCSSRRPSRASPPGAGSRSRWSWAARSASVDPLTT